MEAIYRIEESSGDSVKYAQQHLANERTYLAWIRTAISIAGVGFLTTSLHFTSKISSNPFINTLVIILGIFACVICFIICVLSTCQYRKKKKGNSRGGVYIPSNHSIIFVSSIFSFLVFMILMYLTLLLLMKS